MSTGVQHEYAAYLPRRQALRIPNGWLVEPFQAPSSQPAGAGIAGWSSWQVAAPAIGCPLAFCYASGMVYGHMSRFPSLGWRLGESHRGPMHDLIHAAHCGWREGGNVIRLGATVLDLQIAGGAARREMSPRSLNEPLLDPAGLGDEEGEDCNLRTLILRRSAPAQPGPVAQSKPLGARDDQGRPKRAKGVCHPTRSYYDGSRTTLLFWRFYLFGLLFLHTYTIRQHSR
jgi:hypothetical protein